MGQKCEVLTVVMVYDSRQKEKENKENICFYVLMLAKFRYFSSSNCFKCIRVIITWIS